MDLKNKSLPSQLFHVVRFLPIHFLFLQVFEAASTVLEHLVEKQFETQPLLAAVLFFPFFCAASAIGNGLTLLSVQSLLKGETPTFKSSWDKLVPHWKPLLLASLVLGLVFVLGFCALIVPAFYFMAVYLFVPALILTESGGSLSSHLFHSKRIAKKSLPFTMGTVIASLALGVVAYLLGQTLGTWAGGFSEIPIARNVISLGLDIFFSMVSSALIDIWVALLFFKLKEG